MKIRLLGLSESYPCRPEQNVLDALGRLHNKAISVGCRSGGCGLCKIQILTGNYRCDMMSRAHVTEQDYKNGFSLACKTYPKSDLLIKPNQKIPKKWLESIRPLNDKPMKLKAD